MAGLKSKAGAALLLTVALIFLPVFSLGCGGEDEEEQAPTTPTKAAEGVTVRTSTQLPSPTVAAQSEDVEIKNFAFSPAQITIKVGTKVKWTNEDGVPHTATADDGSFDSGNLASGESYEFTFNQAGNFPYICTLHPAMEGTITVE